jgi:pyruvyltransferase
LAIDVVHWNPRRSLYRGHLRIGPRKNNFGDLLGPIIVKRLLERAGIDPRSSRDTRRLLAVGSIMHFAREGDVVWGTGVNGRSLDLSGKNAAETQDLSMKFAQLDVRAVRGPLTRDYLAARNISAPAVFGDPGLLVGALWSRDELVGAARLGSAIHRPVTVVPNFHDFAGQRSESGVVDPQGPLRHVLGAIAASDFVVGSSLHGVVVAESLGIPARLVVSGNEPLFKYRDYYAGTGRPEFSPASSVAEARELGGEPLPSWDATPLLDAFPYDLWR